ncbi:GNAT family N-acetyltransferase [Aeromonas salmonicida]|uniref:GNAT family N-acetyltransferase n=1 Tax=Aeromonas salmonicida TaxID=645 RepID=UPI00223F207C|nr:GNAT family N-acetyltransferase [Aeromonas salmonicida]MDF8331234.1 GNAT family N-acetyltransferase [Aeromonas salmonicida]HDN9016236.1 GNAT family N-acetyltransferase [Aeromonas salmonicida]
MVVIRTCNEQDVAGLLALYRELRPHDPQLVEAEAALASLLAQSHVRLIVAEVEGQLAATCQLGVIPTLTNGSRPFGIIEHVITAARFRRQGLSQKVLEQALAIAWQQDCYKVMLLSGEGRESAHRLYEKLGFKAGIEKGFVIKQVDAKGTAEPLR